MYAAREPTPLEQLDAGFPAEVWVKREDQPPIHAYKWRGAYNRMATLPAEELGKGVVCASAGSHAQGVALANICYFNYLYTGETVGRALVSLEFDSGAKRERMLGRLREDDALRQRYSLRSRDAVGRMLRGEAH